MKYKGYNILKIVAKKREVPFRDLLNRIPQKHSNHMDWFELAGLCMEGYIDTTLPKMDSTLAYAELFQAYYQKSAYGRIHPLRADSDNGRFYILAKGDLYFQSLREKHYDRLYGIVVAVVTGIIVGVMATYLSSNYFQ